MFRHNLARSGKADSASTLPQGTVKWVFSTGSQIHSSPAVANGTVYFGARDSKLYAVDASTGTKRWEYETGSWIESSPAIVNGVVYVGSNDSRLYALDANSGKRLWEVPVDDILDDFRNETRRLQSQSERLGYHYKIVSTSLLNGVGVGDAMQEFFNAIRPKPQTKR